MVTFALSSSPSAFGGGAGAPQSALKGAKPDAESAVPPRARPSIEIENSIRAFQGQRQPGLSPIELDLERMPNGQFRVRSVDPQGPYGGLVQENEIFDSLDQIPQPAKHQGP